MIGYFFQERFAEVPSVESLPALQARDAVRVMRFGDLGLIKSQWPILGRRSDWSAEEWPMPAFGRREPTGRAFRVIYSPDDLRGPIAEEPIPDDECDQLPRDALSGAGAVERVLTALLVPG